MKDDFLTLFNKAKELDKQDSLAHLRQEFEIPKNEKGEEKIYLCGNSLGLLPKLSRQYVNEELDKWSHHGVEGHFAPEHRPWLSYHEEVTSSLAALAGAKKSEVVAMNSLTTNLHLLLMPFFRPSGKRTKILREDATFPSDIYAINTHLHSRQLDPKDHLIVVKSESPYGVLSTEAILETIEKHKDEIATILMSGVHYLSGQLFDIKKITSLAHQYGIMVGFDLAHAFGNVPLNLHDTGVDFAAWCTYKYLNSGPGSIAGIFIHEKHHASLGSKRPFYAGWWGENKKLRFQMREEFTPIESVERMQLSNPPILQLAALKGSLDVFDKTTIKDIRRKSISITAFLEEELRERFGGTLTLITPRDKDERGAQLSLALNHSSPEKIVDLLSQRDCICDFRSPNIIRVAPASLYNSYTDVANFIKTFHDALQLQG